jgi:Hypoxia induced protein conserved region.
MSDAISLLMLLPLAGVLLVLLAGVLAFAKGGPWYERNATRLMNLRVGAQLAAVLLFALAVWVTHKG